MMLMICIAFWVTGDNLKDFAKNIGDDFFDFGGVERGPEAGNCCPELYFWILTLFTFFLHVGDRVQDRSRRRNGSRNRNSDRRGEQGQEQDRRSR